MRRLAVTRFELWHARFHAIERATEPSRTKVVNYWHVRLTSITVSEGKMTILRKMMMIVSEGDMRDTNNKTLAYSPVVTIMIIIKMINVD